MPVAALRSALSWLTTPLLPHHFLGLVDPLWSTDLCGRVESVRRDTADASTLHIRTGRGWPGHTAGQHVAVGVDVDGVRSWRTYSISSPPGADMLAVTVKAQPGGRVSQVLARETRPGTIVQLGAPTGDFVLPPGEPGPLLFVTAGSGITPVAAMLRELAAGAYPLDAVLVHSARDPAAVIFGAELRNLARRGSGLRLHEHHTRVAGRRLTAADVAALCPDWARRRAYACGPEGLLAALEAHWTQAGRPLRTERFRLPARAATGGEPAGRPDTNGEPASRPDGGPGRVLFTRSGRSARTDGGTPLLDVGERLGLPMPSGCRQGVCRGCLVVLREGRVRDLRDGRVHGEPGDHIQTCVSVPAGPIELDL